MDIPPKLKEKVTQLPLTPGCYLFKDSSGEIIYIGKSKALKKRVLSYFRTHSRKEGKIFTLVNGIRDLDYINTPSETHALLLECKLIKTHKPKFNAQHINDRQFAFIRVEKDSFYPALTVVSENGKDNAHYFGFFYSEDDAHKMLERIGYVWRTPVCGKIFSGSKPERACLNYHIGKCMAPCEKLVESNEYNGVIDEIVGFLKGKTTKVLRNLHKDRKEYSLNMEFEKAAAVNNKIRELKKLERRVKRLNTSLSGKRIFVFVRAFNEDGFTLFYIENGACISNIHYSRLHMDLERTNQFVTAIEQQCYVKDDYTDWSPKELSTCIMAIFCDKLFVNITGGFTAQRVTNRLNKEFAEFIKEYK